MVLTHQRSKMYPIKWEFMVRNSRKGERGVRERQPVGGGKAFPNSTASGRQEGRSPGVMSVPGCDADFHVRPLSRRACAWQLWEGAMSDFLGEHWAQNGD